ncbi:transmembrane sensor domain-containing protein, partial [Alcanivorax sp. 521-1]
PGAVQNSYLAELHYVDTTLIDRMIEARYRNTSHGAKVFISHSSRDKTFARWIGTDLKAAGHTPWFDEWDIQVGESIPAKISDGLREADFVVVVLSEHAVSSQWVEREWHAKYWNEVSQGRIHVLPALYKDCEIPELLKTKRYADFRNNYNDGLEDLLVAIDRLNPSEELA